MKIKNILIVSLLLFLFTIIQVDAETKTVKIEAKNNKVNLVEIAEAGNYLYTISDNCAVFHFEEDIIKIMNNSPFIEINGSKELISTEKLNDVVLPKYEPINILENVVKIKLDLLKEYTTLNIKNKTVLIEPNEIKIKKPKAKDIQKLDINYINGRLFELGYDSNGEYIIDSELLQTIKTGSGYLKITDMNETEFQNNNIKIRELLVKTILELVLENNYVETYYEYKKGNTFEKTYEDITVKTWTEGKNKVIEFVQTTE